MALVSLCYYLTCNGLGALSCLFKMALKVGALQNPYCEVCLNDNSNMNNQPSLVKNLSMSYSLPNSFKLGVFWVKRWKIQPCFVCLGCVFVCFFVQEKKKWKALWPTQSILFFCFCFCFVLFCFVLFFFLLFLLLLFFVLFFSVIGNTIT